MNCEDIFILFLINDKNKKVVGFKNCSINWKGFDEMEGSMNSGSVIRFRDKQIDVIFY
jgi:hypothetical protein